MMVSYLSEEFMLEMIFSRQSFLSAGQGPCWQSGALTGSQIKSEIHSVADGILCLSLVLYGNTMKIFHHCEALDQ